MKTNYKRIFLLFMMIFLFFGMDVTQPGFADDGEETKKMTDIMDIITDQYGEFKEGGKSYYHLDAVSDKDVESYDDGEKFWADTYDKLFGWADVKENVGNKLSEMVNLVNNIVFDINIFLSYTMLVMYDLAYTADFTEKIIMELEKLMSNLTGISGGGFSIGNGLFGNLVKLIAIITGMYALYVFVVKRAFFDSFSSVFQTIIALTIAILMFANYTALLTGANKITTELSGFVVSLPSQNGDSDSVVDDPRTKMKDSIWGMFVDRPYLYMQYGTHDVETLGGGDRDEGVKRVKHILKEPVGEDRLTKVIEEEASNSGKGNNMMKYSAVNSRLAFSFFYMVINGLVSIPIYLLSLCLILFQFWFMVIAALAPFALLIGAIPGQFNVLKRYFIELGIPLALKIFVSFIALIVFVISDIIYAGDFKSISGGSNPFYSYVGAATFNLLLFGTIFILRNRIKDIFSSGSNAIRDLRESSGTFTAPFKKGVQNVATVGGAAAGAVVGGPAGAMTGAAIGGSVGKVATGEGGISDVAGSAMKAKHLAHLSKMTKSQQAAKLSVTDKGRLDGFFDDKNLTPEMKAETMGALEKEGVTNLSDEELNEQFEKISSKGDLDGNFAQTFAKGISDDRRSNAIEKEKDLLFVGRAQRQEQAKAVLSDKGIPSEMVNATMTALDQQGLHDVSPKELHTQHDKLMKQGDLNDDYATTFAKGISDERKSIQLQKEKQDVYGEVEYELHMNKSMVTNELANKGVPPEMINQTLDTLNERGLNNVSPGEMNRHFDLVVEQAEKGEWKNGFADTFASNIENERRAIELEKERKAILEGNNLKSFDKFMQ
ncbi:CD3337/EF1877 family mobilome membrane protein [Sporosarcina sp. Marseille-Q4063]|uniref:CD3337/EF1877 family mobilome membrane protein n=1 Tax=Sporosarcina sp. Marseille-Q4063 TaxID=2810514 RepID=UPI003530525B